MFHRQKRNVKIVVKFAHLAVHNTFDRSILEPQDRHRRMNETTFDVIPTQDESGYWVRICSKDRCCDAFVSSMHLTEDKKPQLMKCILKS